MTRDGNEARHRERHQRRRHDPTNASDFRATPVDFAVDAHFAKHALGQGAVERHERPRFVGDPSHRQRRADKEIVLAHPGAAMAESMDEARGRKCSRGKPDLLVEGGRHRHFFARSRSSATSTIMSS
jgi:hypothetical protein